MANNSPLPVFCKQFGTTKFEIDTNKIDGYMQDKMAAAIAEAKAPDSVYVKYPATEGQDEISYNETAASDPEFPRKADESCEEHAARTLKRGLKPGSKQTLRILNNLAPLFGQPQIPEADFFAVPIQDVRVFVFNVLNFADLQTAQEYLPKRVIGGNAR